MNARTLQRPHEKPRRGGSSRAVRLLPCSAGSLGHTQRAWGEGDLQWTLSCVRDVLPLVMADLYQPSPSTLICSRVLYPETLRPRTSPVSRRRALRQTRQILRHCLECLMGPCYELPAGLVQLQVQFGSSGLVLTFFFSFPFSFLRVLLHQSWVLLPIFGVRG